MLQQMEGGRALKISGPIKDRAAAGHGHVCQAAACVYVTKDHVVL
jgi:hypothetical protein